MTLTYVPLVLDLYDGAGNLPQSGFASFVPSAVLTDPAGHMMVARSPVTADFTGVTSPPMVLLLATDNSPLAPTGWAWQASFGGLVNGAVAAGRFPGAPPSFSFFLSANALSFTATNATPCVFTAAGSAFADGDAVMLTGASLPAGFDAGTVYYAVSASGTTFELAATAGGSPIASTSTGSGAVIAVQYLSALAPASDVTTMAAYLPIDYPAGAANGYVWTSDTSGNGSWQAPAGGGGTTLTPTGVKTGNYTASAGQAVPVDTTSASVTVTLPTAPAGGTLLAVKQVILGAGHSVTVACGGSDVFNKAGGSTTLTLSLASQGVLLAYNSGVWIVLADDLPLAQLDGRYAQLADNLSDLPSAGAARTNLGLGAAALIGTPVSIANGGTGQATQQAALDALAGAVTSGLVLRGNGTHVTLAAIQAADVPTLNQSTSGTAAGLSSTLVIGSGGTGQATQQAAMDALAGAVTSAQFLRGNGTHVVMGAIQAADMPAGTTSAQGALQLDGTAGHILALGAQAAGANGKPADSGHVHPTTGVALLAGANFTGPLTVAASTQLGSGSAAFAGGAGVVGLANAGTPASGTVSGGLVLFSSAGQLQILNSAGLLLTAQGAQPSPVSPVSVTTTGITSLGGLTVPANDPVAGAIYRLTLYGFTTNSGTPTCTVDIRWGGTGGTLLCSLQVTLPALTGCFWQAEALVTFTSTTACNAQLNFIINTAVGGGYAAGSHLVGTTTPATVTTSSNELLTIDATVSSTTGLTFTCLGGAPERVA